MIAGALSLGVASLWWTIDRWGAVGATFVWVLHGVSDLTIGLWLMHQRLLRGELRIWWRTVLFPPLLCCAPIVGLSRFMMPPDLGRWSIAVWLGATGLLVTTGLLLLSGRMNDLDPAPSH
jgi:hypothetical protein